MKVLTENRHTISKRENRGLQIGERALNIGTAQEILNGGNRDFKSQQRLQIGSGVTNWCRTAETLKIAFSRNASVYCLLFAPKC